MKQYRLVKVGEHYVALSRGNAKPERSLEQLLNLELQKKGVSMSGGDGGGSFERIPIIHELPVKALTNMGAEKGKRMKTIEAISVLECIAIDCAGLLCGLSKTDPMADVLQQRIEAIDMAQAALRKEDA